MARKVFFSFHFQRDSWRVSQVRNSNVITSKYAENDFLDAVDWEKVANKGDSVIKKWIDDQLHGTSVTIVLIGYETANRKYVNYEIEQSFKRGNGLLGIYINNIQNQFKQTDHQGANPLDNWWYFTDEDFLQFNRIYFSQKFKTYDWVYNNGRENITLWIEEAAKIAGR